MINRVSILICRRLVVRQRGVTRGDKHTVAMLTFCGEIIAVMITTIILRPGEEEEERGV